MHTKSVQRAPLNQDLTGLPQIGVDFRFDLWVDHHVRTPATRTRKARSGSEQATNQWPLRVGIAAKVGQVRTTPCRKGPRMLGITLDRQPGHFLGRSCHGATAIMASRDACKCRNATPEEPNYLAIVSHRILAASCHTRLNHAMSNA